MNERIWELAEQAITDDLPTPIAIPAEFVVRLAELIVRECASVVNSRDDSDTGFWANIIKEHFGVEE